MFNGLSNGIGRVLGYAATPTESSTATPSIVAEPDTTAVAFPAPHSQQRAGAKAAPPPPPPTVAVSAPALAGPTQSDSDSDPFQEGAEEEEEEEDLGLPSVQVNGSGAATRPSPATTTLAAPQSSLLPPPSTTKVVKAPKGRVRVEKGFSQLDWAKLNRDGQVDLRGGVTSLLRVTPSELAKHNTREDCWQVYAGKVYNVGPFLRYHPGGAGEMMRGAGKDVLAHAWVNYETLLENCLVGFLVPE
ncbi:hypothetical protein JCM8202_003647 [Rhodotorula sphaerocarpa]